MWAVGKARQLVPDSVARAVDQRVRYAGLMRTVETLARSYEANAAKLPAQPASTRGSRRPARASSRPAGSRPPSSMDEAVKALERAERELHGGAQRDARVGDAATTRRASARRPRSTPTNSSATARTGELVPVAIAELKPRREAVVLVERYVAANARQLAGCQGPRGRRPPAGSHGRTADGHQQPSGGPRRGRARRAEEHRSELNHAKDPGRHPLHVPACRCAAGRPRADRAAPRGRSGRSSSARRQRSRSRRAGTREPAPDRDHAREIHGARPLAFRAGDLAAASRLLPEASAADVRGRAPRRRRRRSSREKRRVDYEARLESARSLAAAQRRIAAEKNPGEGARDRDGDRRR